MSTKKTFGLGMPWEKEYGYAQGVRIDNMAWISGQLGHDEQGNLAEGMDKQFAYSYTNIERVLAGLEMSIDDVVEEVIYVLDMASAFEARSRYGQVFYKEPMQVASTIVVVQALAIPGQLVEIKVVAKKA
ncbi:Rid family hydrolase [Terrimonas sp. NA20]|uniref:Rid family hydrolase n=1 Tax=Terrimonas ginsenosidimutans TaxID=2908004 RepID=A0ABS9KV00_9BACT|nr:Rid family hydrolase [Terrimonas ginsenosidimutans]MCG2616174.1 Rid family hydrolase [Terrimonas ginsenosidimutans]